MNVYACVCTLEGEAGEKKGMKLITGPVKLLALQ